MDTNRKMDRHTGEKGGVRESVHAGHMLLA